MLHSELVRAKERFAKQQRDHLETERRRTAKEAAIKERQRQKQE